LRKSHRSLPLFDVVDVAVVVAVVVAAAVRALEIAFPAGDFAALSDVSD